MLFLPLDIGVRLVLWNLFHGSSREIRACKGRKGNFFEEQKALEMILGCFLEPCFVWAGEAMTEFCAEGGRLTLSKMFL